MGNACNCVSKEDQKGEADMGKKKDAAKKRDPKHDDSNVEDDGEEKPGQDDPELVGAAIKIQVGEWLLLLSRSIVANRLSSKLNR